MPAALATLARDSLAKRIEGHADITLVQALFNMAVVQEGTARANSLWTPLIQSLS